jgi:hypothetical protein
MTTLAWIFPHLTPRWRILTSIPRTAYCLVEYPVEYPKGITSYT